MGDLIDRNCAVEILRAKANMTVCMDIQMGYESAARVIENIPAVDAEPVRHGMWRHLGGDEWSCTMCGEAIHTEGTEKPEDKYCRECGAKMDREEE